MTKFNKKTESNNPDRTKTNIDWKFEFFALCGFCISGILAIVSGIKSGDALTIIGSFVWFFSCVVWMIPYRKYFDKADLK